MKFYTVKLLNDGVKIEAQGIDIMTMSTALKTIEKKSDLKTLDKIIDLLFVVLEKPYEFSNTEALVFSHHDKKINFALANPEKIFEIKDDKNNNYFCAIHEGKLKANLDKKSLQKIINHSTVLSADPIEVKAIHWLNHGRVGLSSGTMCATLFPNLKEHHNLVSLYDYDGKLEVHWPHDNDDFGRCRKFLEAVPEAKERFGELKALSKEWKNLVENWDAIETLVREQKSEDAYNLIKVCVRPKKILKAQ